MHYCYGITKHIYGPLTRYVKLQVAHAPGMPGTFSPAADFKENRLIAIPACITARAWRTCRDACRDRLHAVTGKTFPAFPAHAHPQFYVSGKRPMWGSHLYIAAFSPTQSTKWILIPQDNAIAVCHDIMTSRTSNTREELFLIRNGRTYISEK